MGSGGTGARVLAAIPAIAFAILIVANGGLLFALGVAALGVIGLSELYTMMARVRPVHVAGFAAVIALCLAALYGDQYQVLLVLVASLPLTFVLAIARPWRRHVSWAIAVTML